MNRIPRALVAVLTDGFVFLDTETTGMDSDSRVIDIALVQTSRNGELEKIYICH